MCYRSLWWRLRVVTLLLGCFCRCWGFWHRTESDIFLFPFINENIFLPRIQFVLVNLQNKFILLLDLKVAWWWIKGFGKKVVIYPLLFFFSIFNDDALDFDNVVILLGPNLNLPFDLICYRGVTGAACKRETIIFSGKPVLPRDAVFPFWD